MTVRATQHSHASRHLALVRSDRYRVFIGERPPQLTFESKLLHGRSPRFRQSERLLAAPTYQTSAALRGVQLPGKEVHRSLTPLEAVHAGFGIHQIELSEDLAVLRHLHQVDPDDGRPSQLGRKQGHRPELVPSQEVRSIPNGC